MQCPMACPGLATHALAGLCALWLPSAASFSGNLHKPAKPQPTQITCTALPHPPVQAPPRLLHTAEAAFYLVVPHCTTRAGYIHWQGSVHCACQAMYPQLKNIRKWQNRNPHKKQLPSTSAAPTAGSTSPAAHFWELHLTVQCPMACPGLATHALAELCALWLLSQASYAENLQKAVKPQPPQTTCPSLPQHPVQAPPHLLQTAGAAFHLTVHHCTTWAGYIHTGRALCTVVAKQCILN